MLGFLCIQSFAEFTELFSEHCCTGRQLITSITRLFPLLLLAAVIAVVRPLSGLLWASIVFCTNNNARRTIAHKNSAPAYVRSAVPTLNCFLKASAISALMVENPIFAVISLSYSLTVAKTVEANVLTFRSVLAILILFQFCYTAIAEVASFLRNSCSRLQVQTVPSSTRDAPCPVVTPSRFTGLARRCLDCYYVLKTHYLLISVPA